jgi:hypothetical protein
VAGCRPVLAAGRAATGAQGRCVLAAGRLPESAVFFGALSNTKPLRVYAAPLTGFHLAPDYLKKFLSGPDYLRSDRGRPFLSTRRVVTAVACGRLPAAGPGQPKRPQSRQANHRPPGRKPQPAPAGDKGTAATERQRATRPQAPQRPMGAAQKEHSRHHPPAAAGKSTQEG